jgi:hypothetical protein
MRRIASPWRLITAAASRHRRTRSAAPYSSTGSAKSETGLNLLVAAIILWNTTYPQRADHRGRGATEQKTGVR